MMNLQRNADFKIRNGCAGPRLAVLYDPTMLLDVGRRGQRPVLRSSLFFDTI